jgi:hypothetical protein
MDVIDMVAIQVLLVIYARGSCLQCPHKSCLDGWKIKPWRFITTNNGFLSDPCNSPLFTNFLWLLVGVVAVRLLHLLHVGDVLLLGLFNGDLSINKLLPRALLCLALY